MLVLTEQRAERTPRFRQVAKDGRDLGGDSSGEVLWFAAGGMLMLSGLLRRSWAGLTLAALGGYLVWHGLWREHHSQGPSTTPPLPFQEGEAQEGADPNPVEMVETAEEELLAQAVDEEASWLDAPLSAEEHARAEVSAYFLALERGGGQLPPYDLGRAVEDFCRAAGEVMRQRSRSLARFTQERDRSSRRPLSPVAV